ncbi:MAG: PD-(D/E)XK nuclease family protein [Alphaproteobacteria bacterium]|nr:PD-(D/E)XK nuclease family protein [Alphaproteobacteria bacterium]
MGELQNTFSWSYSRHGLFAQCRRKYWLNHYAFWGGWSRRAPARARALYVQKKLTTQPMWIGTVVHEIAEGALKAMQQGVTPWVERAVEMARERAEADIEASRAGRYEQDPKRYPGFQCHYYGQEEPDFDAAIEQIEAQLRTLFAHPVFRRMMAVPERIVEVEELRQIDIEGVPVWVVLDAMVSDGEGGLVIIDWKTGKDHEDEKIARQLGIYGIYATQERGVPVEQVRTLHVNTRFNTMTQHPVDAAVLDETRAFVRESADAMRAALTKPAENEGREEDFPMLPEGDPACERCRFRRDCGRE